MKNIFQKILSKKFITENAVPLDSVGVNNFAWKVDPVLHVVETLSEQQFAVLGGDVFLLTKDGIEISYDNWYMELEESQAWMTYVQNANTYAEEYIKNYINRHSSSVSVPIFSLTIANEVEHQNL